MKRDPAPALVTTLPRKDSNPRSCYRWNATTRMTPALEIRETSVADTVPRVRDIRMTRDWLINRLIATKCYLPRLIHGGLGQRPTNQCSPPTVRRDR